VTQDGQVMEEPFLDISDQVLDAFLEQGLYDIEFHPEFADNGRFFVHFAELMRNGDSMIIEYQVSGDNPDRADPESARPILQIDQPWANHNGGYLYIGSGDGGWEGDPLEAGQNLNTLLGKLLRIDVNNTDGRPYAIPEDNPFAASQAPQQIQLFGISEETFAGIHTEARPEIWAYGLRNPWKFQFDSQTGDLYLPDVGQNHWEEINFQPADSHGGENYGWDFLMGTHCFPIQASACSAVGTLPVAEYSHDLGCSVTGIGIYRGDEFGDLNGVYFSGDYCSGRIWGLTHDDAGNWRYAEVLDTNIQITSGGEGEDGNLYVTSCNCNYGGPAPEENPPGSLWRIVPTDQVPEGAETVATQ
jgi:glucose/arabinose dehydrogenase